MPKLKKGLILPTPEEDAAIDAGIKTDPDTYELSKTEFGQLKRVGRPKSASPKVLLSVRYSQEVVDYFRSTGDGWQARMDGVLRAYVKQHEGRR